MGVNRYTALLEFKMKFCVVEKCLHADRPQQVGMVQMVI